jgi:LysR family glycine cleavage system transcriptional activator
VREAADRANPRRLRVTTTPSFAARWLLPRLQRFGRASGIDLDVSATMQLVDLARESIDVAIRYGFGHWPGLHAEHLHDDAFFPVASPRLVGARPPESPADLAASRCCATRTSRGSRGSTPPGSTGRAARGPGFEDAAFLVQTAVAGHGVALAAQSLVVDDLRTGALVRLTDVEVATPRSYFFVCLPRDADTPKVAALRAWLRATSSRATTRRSAQHRHPHALRLRDLDRLRVAGVGVPHHAGSGIVPQHALDPLRRRVGPSQTITTPACCEYPMPTPPPWWIDTQVAPPRC